MFIASKPVRERKKGSWGITRRRELAEKNVRKKTLMCEVGRKEIINLFYLWQITHSNFTKVKAWVLLTLEKKAELLKVVLFHF